LSSGKSEKSISYGTPHEKILTRAIIRNESLIDNPYSTGPSVPVEKQAIVAFIVSLRNDPKGSQIFQRGVLFEKKSDMKLTRG
jgi:hypothetical protein